MHISELNKLYLLNIYHSLCFSDTKIQHFNFFKLTLSESKGKTSPNFASSLIFQKTYFMMLLSLSKDVHAEEGMATHSSILTWRIPMDRGAWQAIVHRVAKSQTPLKQLSTHTLFNNNMRFIYYICIHIHMYMAYVNTHS